MPSSALRFLVLGFGVAVVSFAAILIRFAQAEGASSIVIAAGRLTIAALVLAPFAWWRAGTEMLRLPARVLGMCLLSGAMLAVHFWAWITSLEHTSVASSTALVTTNPLWVALASAILLRERPGRAALAGIALTLAGSVLIFAADAGRSPEPQASPLLGNILALVGAVAASGYLLAGRALRSRVSLFAYIWIAYSSAALMLLAAAAAADDTLLPLSPGAWLLIAALALGPQLIGHTAFNWALRSLSATFVAVAILGEPVGSAILAYLLLGEGFGAVQIWGFVILLAGIFIAARAEPSAQPIQEPGVLRCP